MATGTLVKQEPKAACNRLELQVITNDLMCELCGEAEAYGTDDHCGKCFCCKETTSAKAPVARRVFGCVRIRMTR